MSSVSTKITSNVGCNSLTTNVYKRYAAPEPALLLPLPPTDYYNPNSKPLRSAAPAHRPTNPAMAASPAEAGRPAAAALEQLRAYLGLA